MTDKHRTSDARLFDDASRILESGALGRGHTYPQLLAYLVDRALRGEIPKEFDISVDVFGKAGASTEAPDTQTRVHIYKLRSRLELFMLAPARTMIFVSAYRKVRITSLPSPNAVEPAAKRPWKPRPLDEVPPLGLLRRPSHQRLVVASLLRGG